MADRDPTQLRALDLGTGSGIVAALLARAGMQTVGVDVRPEWGPLWERTLAASQTPGELHLIRADVAHEAWSDMDLVTSNPPFFPARTGPVAEDPWRAAARTESTATLERFVAAGLGALARCGSFCLVIPVERAHEVRAAAQAHGAGVRRAVRVGRRRWLADLRLGQKSVKDALIDEAHPRAARWYALARADGPAAADNP